MNRHADAFADVAGCGDPAPVAAAIAALLRTLPGPSADPATSPDVVRAWLAAKADLLERVATATADPDLAARAAACAARARAVTRPICDLTCSTEGAPS